MTEDEKNKIFELWEKGLSGQAIGNMLGYSRCSILGFINRQRKNGYVFERPFGVKKLRPKKEEKIIEDPVEENILIEIIEKEIIQEKEIAEEPQEIIDESVDLMGLKPTSCRYPISADGAYPVMFCGKQQERGSYCKEHGAICYYPSKYQISKLVD